MPIDWVQIREKLPVDKTEEAKAKRMALFDQFDPNNNGYLSLAEVDKGCRDVLGIYEIFQAKKVILRAFEAARGLNDPKVPKGDLGCSYVERMEFRMLLLYLRQYFEIWQIFDQVDSDDDHRLDLAEFKAALPKLEAWGMAIEDADATFAEMDTNGGGKVLFGEFSDWALKKKLNFADAGDN
jgi:Ca2+-binding EF-hand superfamily protein